MHREDRVIYGGADHLRCIHVREHSIQHIFSRDSSVHTDEVLFLAIGYMSLPYVEFNTTCPLMDLSSNLIQVSTSFPRVDS